MAIKIGEESKNIKVLDERETRKKLLAQARQFGIEKDLTTILDKYDTLMRNCSNEKERRDIGKLGAFEVYNLFNRGGDLYVDGQLVYSHK